MYFWRVLKNTLMISLYDLIFGFPAPLILALLLNEVKNALFKRSVQTITYLPHFISLVIICGMIKDFTSSDGVINDIIAFFGGERVTMLLEPSFSDNLRFVEYMATYRLGYNYLFGRAVCDRSRAI